jgi:hypothetical protein
VREISHVGNLTRLPLLFNLRKFRNMDIYLYIYEFTD